MPSVDKISNSQNVYLARQKAVDELLEALEPVEDITPQQDIDLQIRDEFVKEKKNTGLVGKTYNFLKNKSDIGLGTKKVEAEIDKYENGEISEDQVREKISQYKISRENAVQQTANLVTGAATISSFFWANNSIKRLRASFKLDTIPEWYKNLREAILNSKYLKKGLLQIEGTIKSDKKTLAVLVPAVALMGGFTKLAFTKLERTGSKEYKTDKNLDKQTRKAQKKINRKARRKENLKNFATGTIQGALAPVTALVGGIVGVPVYLAGITALKYGTSKNDNKAKSFEDFTKSLQDNAVVNTVALTAIGVPAFRHANFSKVLSENLDKVVKKLSGKQLHLPDLPTHKTAYQELEDILLNSESIQKILSRRDEWGSPLPINQILSELTEENIFAVKFLQIKNNSGISKALQEDCPATRTLQQAQAHINQMWGSAEYTISKLLSVGTIAETYLAKDKSGKEVCIKILKKGMDAEKIAKDKEKFIKLITGGKPLEQLSEDQKYLLKNIEDLAKNILEEVDFKHEMQAAKDLAPHCEVADVVKPISAKDGIYVMEKAPGISVKTLADYYDCQKELKRQKDALAQNPSEVSRTKKIKDLENKIKQIKSKSPDFEDFEMTPEQIKRLLKTYIDLQVEQFSKLNKNGKVIHADIHPGNIFINLNALKTGKGKLFTLIDTGNTVRLSKEQTKASLKIIPYIKNGNTKELAKIAVDGATLPNGMSKDEAVKKVEADLKKFFFDSETKIEIMNVDTFYALSDNILRKYRIIPNNTQLNLNKAKTSANKSFDGLVETFFESKYGDIMRSMRRDMKAIKRSEVLGTATQFTKDISEILLRRKLAPTLQETKNLFQMSFKEIWNFIRNKNNLKTNSEEYLTYKFKQKMNEAEILGV